MRIFRPEWGGRAHFDTEIDGDNNSEVNEVNV
jgi:hypothetical protein